MALTKLKFAGVTLAVLTVGGFIAVTPGIAQQAQTREAAPPAAGGREGPPPWAREGRPWMRGPQTGPGGMPGANMGRMCEERIARMAQFRVQRIEQAVKPTDTQRAAFEEFKNAAQKAAEIARGACPAEMALTPTGRLEMAEKRMETRLQAIRTVRPALDAFYKSLSDEQKARFNALSAHRGPQWAHHGQRWHHMWRGRGADDERGGWRGWDRERDGWHGRGDENREWRGRGEREGWQGRQGSRDRGERQGSDGRHGGHEQSDGEGEERL